MKARLLLWRGRRREPSHYPIGPLRELAAAAPPDDATPVSQVEFLAIDIETTGLDPRTHHVLSVGWVPIARRELVLAEAREHRVRPPGEVDVGSSASLHRLTDDLVSAADGMPDLLPGLLEALHGRVLIAHHARIETDFLGRATRAAYGARLPVTAVDTMALQQRLLGDHHRHTPGSLRLDAARRTFGLPRYAAHDALTDAIAGGELFLAQVAELEGRLGRAIVLGDLSPRRSG